METMQEATQAEIPVKERVFVLGGRQFKRATKTTVDQDAYTTRRMRSAGLVKIWEGFNPREATTADRDALIEAVIFEAFEQGVLYEILAGTLVEEGVRWTRAYAAHNSVMFRDIKDDAEKDTLWANVADVIIDFLQIAASWQATSRKRSELSKALDQSSGGQSESL